MPITNSVASMRQSRLEYSSRNTEARERATSTLRETMQDLNMHRFRGPAKTPNEMGAFDQALKPL
jgi:hypothetical protein